MKGAKNINPLAIVALIVKTHGENNCLASIVGYQADCIGECGNVIIFDGVFVQSRVSNGKMRQ
jgi:hypothetical protein